MPKTKVIPPDESFEMTFIALMLLLLCFMVILVSLAQLEGNRFRKAIGSVKGALAMLTDVSSPSMLQDRGTGVLLKDNTAPMEDLVGQLEEFEAVLMETVPAELREYIVVERGAESQSLTLGDMVLFERGGSSLVEEATPLMQAVAEFLSFWPGNVDIVGHTCDLPIQTTAFPSNWDLSVARAAEVAARLDAAGVDGWRVSATGVGDAAPLVPNSSEANRRKNRRVEVILETHEWPTGATEGNLSDG